MQINTTTKYNIGDILYLQQTNGGGLRKVIIVGIVKNKGAYYYIFNKSIVCKYGTYILHKVSLVIEHSILGIERRVKHARRGNIWLTEKPPKKRKPLTSQTLKYWVQRNV